MESVKKSKMNFPNGNAVQENDFDFLLKFPSYLLLPSKQAVLQMEHRFRLWKTYFKNIG
jgi:hypothetical protein